MKLLVVTKGGVAFTVDADRLEVDYDGDRQISGLRVKDPADGGDLLAAIVPSEVAAVVKLDAPAAVTPVTDDEADPEQSAHVWRPLYGTGGTHPDHPGVTCEDYQAGAQP